MSDHHAKLYLNKQAQSYASGSNEKYFEKQQELDKSLVSLIHPLMNKKELFVLDCGCGAGHLISMLSEMAPNCRFTGVDINEESIKSAVKRMASVGNVEFAVQDVSKLSKVFDKEFDISISWKTLSWLSDYEEVVAEMLKVTRNFVFISSLFYDGDIDFEIKVKQHKSKISKPGWFSYYNVYSLPRFKKFCKKLGARKVKVYDFEIGIDLPKPNPDRMGTYTEKLADGRRLQISGAVVMNWKIIRIDL